MKTTIYSLEDIRTIVRHVGLDRIMDDTIAMLTQACASYVPDDNKIPERDGFDYSEPNHGLIEWMPVMKVGGGVAIKLVGYHPDNPAEHALPTILSTCVSFDTETGHLMTIMDGNFLTAVRTGAASAVASRILAGPDSCVLGLIGCGAQAISQLHALSRVFELKKVFIYDVDAAAQGSFVERAAALELSGIDIEPCSLESLVSKADILCTATTVRAGAGPVFADSLLQPGVHINAVGSDFPGKTEIPLTLLQRSLVCPDFPEQALREGESQLLDADQLGPGLVALVKDQEQFRSYQSSSTVFDSTGWALEDQITMDLLSGYGKELGCGAEVALANVNTDPLNPYAAMRSPLTYTRKVI